MSTKAGSESERWACLIVRGASAALILMGCLVLVGWLLDLVALKAILRGRIAMNPVTALCFILSGAALLLLQPGGQGRRTRIGQACAAIVFLVGLVKTGGYATGYHPGIDQILFRERL